MTGNVTKPIRVLAGPTGSHGIQGVRIFANVTGPSGLHKQHTQLNAGQIGPTGTIKHVYQVSGSTYAAAPTGTYKTIIITGFTGPA